MHTIPVSIVKRVAEVKDYAVEWKNVLGAATINTVVSDIETDRATGVTPVPSLIGTASSKSGTQTIIRLIGGVVGQIVDFKILIEASDAQRFEADFALTIVSD